ncbi:MAG: type II toxin-antitoxin system Phd/YefM family antitoxin [Candidatus Schekmanbacteria bacterium]|nr:type II toxin-antitoxin system Phd/YefM family antitoxin [Candidatus Schekmanbacteria bacterium]
MRTIQASDFKARCLALMDDIARTGETLVITKNGQPVAELRPYSGTRANSPFGLHPTLHIEGDIVSPIAANDWEALA